MIVLDTHVLVWWINGQTESLSENAQRTIDRELSEDGVRASSISAWEIAMLIKKDRLTLSLGIRDWLDAVAQVGGLQFMPIDNRVAVESQALPGEFHPDPADRMLVALARQLDAPLVTADRKIRDYPHVRTIW